MVNFFTWLGSVYLLVVLVLWVCMLWSEFKHRGSIQWQTFAVTTGICVIWLPYGLYWLVRLFRW